GRTSEGEADPSLAEVPGLGDDAAVVNHRGDADRDDVVRPVSGHRGHSVDHLLRGQARAGFEAAALTSVRAEDLDMLPAHVDAEHYPAGAVPRALHPGNRDGAGARSQPTPAPPALRVLPPRDPDHLALRVGQQREG